MVKQGRINCDGDRSVSIAELVTNEREQILQYFVYA